MKRLLLGSVLCLLIGFPAALHAGGLVQSLPKDGSWVRFYMELKIAEPQKIEISGTYTIRSVGRTTVNGKPCRWIELHIEQTQNGKATRTITKVLIAERDFRPKSKRRLKIIRGWIKKNENDPHKLPESDYDQFAFLLSTPLKDRKAHHEVNVIDYQKGQLTIKSGVIGKYVMKVGTDAPANSGLAVTQSIWSHSSIPFGTAALQLEMQAQEGKVFGPKMTMTFTLLDYGVGAKSALPGKK